MSKRWHSLIVAVALGIGAWGTGDLGALTLYRIGGSDLPPPELAGEAGVEFVQLEWAMAEDDPLVEDTQMVVTPDAVSPQVLDPNHNLAPTFQEESGRIIHLEWNGWTITPEPDNVMWDGDKETVYLGDGRWTAHGTLWREIAFEFNGIFLLDRVKIYPRDMHLNDRFMEAYRVGINDGDRLKDGTRDVNLGSRESWLDFDIVTAVSENTDPIIEVKMPEKPVQKLLLEFRENQRGIWEIAEIEIYGRGHAPNARYISQVVDLGRPVTLGDLSWSGYQEEGGRVDLMVRSGDDDDPNTYWRNTFRGDETSRFDENGRPLTRTAYNKLRAAEKAGITHDTENWDFWSSDLQFSDFAGSMEVGEPRRYIQFRVDINSSLEGSGGLGYVQFAVSDPPIASRTVAEIVPTAAPAGEVTEFTYKLLPVLNGGDLGFDHIEIRTPVKAERVNAVRVGGVEVEFEVKRLDETGFEVEIPRMDMQRTNELIEVDFEAMIFKFGTVFSGRVFDSTHPLEVRQVITAGDADELEDSNTLSVALSEIGQDVIDQVRLVPAVFTPNGDGVNDEVRIEADLLNLFGDVPVSVELYDLAGRRVQEIFTGTTASGRFVQTWDGRDAQGNRVVPGLYLVRVEIDSDKGTDTISRVISLAY